MSAVTAKGVDSVNAFRSRNFLSKGGSYPKKETSKTKDLSENDLL
jgi:hypothetical protein